MSLPIETCESCRKTYLVCNASCGNSVRDLRREGETCRCGRGTLEKKTAVICCQRTWHHLGQTCRHCGLEG